MKKNYFNLLCWILLIIPTLFVSCENEDDDDPLKGRFTITFENIELSSQGYWNGSDLTGKKVKEYYYGSLVTNYYNEFHCGELIFHNLFTQDWSSWDGFVCSSLTDTITSGSSNVYSVYAESGATLSKNFMVASNNAVMNFMDGREKQVHSLRLNNTTYSYLAISKGDDGDLNICTKFSDGDYFSVTFTGYDAKGNITNDCTFYLADFRDGKSYICDEWTMFDISSLGIVNKIIITFDSSDKDEYGILTPTYVCIDNLVYSN